MAVAKEDFERAHTLFSGLLRMMDGPALSTNGYGAARRTERDAKSRGSLKLESCEVFPKIRRKKSKTKEDDDEAEKLPGIVEGNDLFFQGPFQSAQEVIKELAPRPIEDLEEQELFAVLEKGIEYVASANKVSRYTAAMAFGYNFYLNDPTTNFAALYITLGKILYKHEAAQFLSAECSHSTASVSGGDPASPLPPKKRRESTRSENITQRTEQREQRRL